MVQSVAVRLYSGSDPMQLLLIFFPTNRKTERIVDIDDHVHAGCRNHTCHNVEDGVLFKNMVERMMLTMRMAEPQRIACLCLNASERHTAILTAIELYT